MKFGKIEKVLTWTHILAKVMRELEEVRLSTINGILIELETLQNPTSF